MGHFCCFKLEKFVFRRPIIDQKANLKHFQDQSFLHPKVALIQIKGRILILRFLDQKFILNTKILVIAL